MDFLFSFDSRVVIVSDVPLDVELARLETHLAQFGLVEACGPAENGDAAAVTSSTRTISVTFATSAQAIDAAGRLDGSDFDGHTLHARRQDDQHRGQSKHASQFPRQRRRSPRQSGVSIHGASVGSQRPFDFPLRILVQSDMVGAVIGKGGQTIREITQHSQ
jgi:hypothetical protein